LVCSKKNNDGTECNGQLRELTTRTSKKDDIGMVLELKNCDYEPSMKCTKKGCQTYQSIRAGNPFFTYTNLNGKCHSNLTLTEIIELVWY